MSKLLTQTQRRSYEEDGLVFPVCALSVDEARRAAAACDELERHLGGKPRTSRRRRVRKAEVESDCSFIGPTQ